MAVVVLNQHGVPYDVLKLVDSIFSDSHGIATDTSSDTAIQ